MRPMTPLWIVLAILAAGLAILLYNHADGRSFGIANEDFGSLVSMLPIGLMLAAGFVVSRGKRLEKLRQLMIWLLILFVFASAYVFRTDMSAYGTRLLSGLLPGTALSVTGTDGRPEVVLSKALSGHFEADATINGSPVHLLIDTGASMVALSHADAIAAGFIPENLAYTTRLMTANGVAMGAPVMISTLTIGSITRRNVPGMVAEAGRLDQSLLGMSFLSTLSSMQMQTDELRLRD